MRREEKTVYWLLFSLPSQGMLECERKVDHHMQLANYLREQVKKKTGFQLVVEVSEPVALWYCGTVVLWWPPRRCRVNL